MIQKNDDIAVEYGKSFAISVFKIFLNPNMRGPNFTWENFPDLAARMASDQFFTTLDETFYQEDNSSHELRRLEKICHDKCKEVAEKLKDTVELMK